MTGPGWEDLENSAAAIRRWNLSAALRWRRLDRRVKGRLRRQGLSIFLMARIAQRQGRGVDHLHLVVSCADPSERHAIAVYVEHLKELAPLYGFGHVDDPFLKTHPKDRNGRPDRSKPKRNRVYESSGIAARYLCSYLTESSQLASMISERDHSFRALWVSPTLTQASGVNCRRLRRVRFAWHVTRALEQGSRPTMPIWWRSIVERQAVLRLLNSPTAFAYY